MLAEATAKLFNRISVAATTDLLARAGLELDNLPSLKARTRTRRILDMLQSAPDAKRAGIEGVAGRIIAFAERDTFAEIALRAACSDSERLLDTLEATESLEERALRVLLSEPKTFDRASSIASGHGWRGGRQHCAFKINAGASLAAALQDAISEIASVVQATQGGRKVDSEYFTYPDLFATEPSNASDPVAIVHHMAVYVEAPASYWIEFGEDQPGIAPVLRREAHEIAIDYYPESGDLHVAGKGVGGSKTLEDVANVFGAKALAGEDVRRIERESWNLDAFVGVSAPILDPPQSFATVTIEEVAFRSRKQRSALVTYRGGEGSDAYARMRALGLTTDKLTLELVRSVTVRFTTIADSTVDQRKVRATVSWPNTLTFDSGMPAERRAITKWMRELSERGKD